MIIYSFIMTLLVVGLMIMVYIKNRALSELAVQLIMARTDSTTWYRRYVTADEKFQRVMNKKCTPHFEKCEVPKDYVDPKL